MRNYAFAQVQEEIFKESENKIQNKAIGESSSYMIEGARSMYWQKCRCLC